MIPLHDSSSHTPQFYQVLFASPVIYHRGKADNHAIEISCSHLCADFSLHHFVFRTLFSCLWKVEKISLSFFKKKILRHRPRWKSEVFVRWIVSFCIWSGWCTERSDWSRSFLCPPLSPKTTAVFTLDPPSGGPFFCQLSRSGPFSVISSCWWIIFSFLLSLWPLSLSHLPLLFSPISLFLFLFSYRSDRGALLEHYLLRRISWYVFVTCHHSL